MKYSIIFFLFLTSCASYDGYSKNKFTYSAKGFTYVIPNSVYIKDQTSFFVSHNKLRRGAKLRITNPRNKEFLDVVVNKKIKYDDFYKVLISSNIAIKLDLNLDFPFVEISEIKSNKSFIAKKAITENVEKKIANKAPVEKIDINNLSKNKKSKKTKLKNFSILVAEFYNLESAELLKKRLKVILKNSNYQMIYVNKNNNNSYELLMGPYNTISKLKNDYIVLKNSNFEDLDITINE